jgi:hypothetical protein
LAKSSIYIIKIDEGSIQVLSKLYQNADTLVGELSKRANVEVRNSEN